MEEQYKLVFKGELLAGHQPAHIRLQAGQRFGANPQQIERLFSGQAVTLKRGLSADAAARYAGELRHMGMRMHVEQDVDAPSRITPAGELWKIVFAGQLISGYEREQVMLAAAERLHASTQQIALLFSGHKTTLKKGLDAQQAKRYASRLRSIGMLAAAEVDQPKSPGQRTAMEQAAAPVDVKASFSHAETHVHSPLMHASDMLHEGANADVNMDFTQTMVDHELIATNAQGALPDMEKTELAGHAMLYAYARGEPLPMEEADRDEQPQHAMERRELGEAGFQVNAMGGRAAGVPARPSMLTALPSNVVPLVRPAAEALQTASTPTLLQVVCAACGARQIQRHRCAHCGYEFPRTTRLAEAARIPPTEPIAAMQSLRADVASVEMQPVPLGRHKRLRYAACALLSIAACVWGLKHIF